MSKLKMHTPDGTKDNIARIAELFPHCIAEAKDDRGNITKAIDFDQLRQELSAQVVDGPRERYHLDWPGKREALLAANSPIVKTLRPAREKSVDFYGTRNLFIEGDNLDALKLLQETYLNSLSIIFIDPPYNTGRDFLYQDDFAQSATEYLKRSGQADDIGSRLVANTEANGRFHSDWLSMMYPRLKLAWNMLAEEGILVATIDDRELFQLGKLLDEIFGSANCLACAPWLSEASGGKEKTGLRSGHEYLLIYFKRTPNGISQEERETGELNLSDDKGPYRKGRELMKWGGVSLRRDRPNQFYELIAPDNSKVLPYRNDGEEGHWRWGKENPSIKQAMQDSNFFHWEKRPFDGIIKVNGQRERWVPYEKIRDSKKTVGWTTWLDKCGTNADATRELKDLFGMKPFDTPKPTSLISWVINLHSDDSGIVMDFFAGSASTAHAVLSVNAQDGGQRRFIMVQLPEVCTEGSPAATAGFATIADVGEERIKRAAKKLKEEAGLNGDKLDLGFRVLKVDTSNMKDVYYEPDAVKQEMLHGLVDNVKDHRTDEDLLFQVLLDWGVDLTLSIKSENIGGKTVYFVDTNALAACFDAGITEAFIKELAKRKPLRAVFRDTGYGSDATKINVEQIFKLVSPGTEVKSI